MPYLPVDLDGKRKAEEIERALGLPRLSVVGGNVDLWEAVWRAWSGGKSPEEAQYVDDLALCSAYGADPRIRVALVARDFLEVAGDRHRVRGAMKWLFGLEGKKRGGRSAKGNLWRGSQPGVQPGTETPQDGASPAKPGPEPGPEPEDTSRLDPRLLHPAAQHPAPNKETYVRTADPVSAMSAVTVPSVAHGAEADRRARDSPLRHVPTVPEKPTKDDDVWGGADFAAWAQAKRFEEGFPPETRINEHNLSAWFSSALMAGFTPRDLRLGFVQFGGDPYWLERKLPVQAFVKEWAKYVRKQVARAS